MRFSTILIIVTGGVFAVLCALMLLVEWTLKAIAVPVIFLFTISSLTYGFIERKISQHG